MLLIKDNLLTCKDCCNNGLHNQVSIAIRFKLKL